MLSKIIAKQFVEAKKCDLMVAVAKNGDIVNINDYMHLGPAFTFIDRKIGQDANGNDYEVAYHIDMDFHKQGAFDITNCAKYGVKAFAKLMMQTTKDNGYIVTKENFSFTSDESMFTENNYVILHFIRGTKILLGISRGSNINSHVYMRHYNAYNWGKIYPINNINDVVNFINMCLKEF